MTNQWLGVGTGTLVRVRSLGIEGYGVIDLINIDPTEAFGHPDLGSDQRGITYAVQMRNGRTLLDIRPDEIEVIDLTDPAQMDAWLRHG